MDACVASASRGASRHGLTTRSAGSFGAGEVVKTCQCWTDFRPAFNALKAAAADPASAVAAQLASVADVDSQMQGMCGNAKLVTFMSCIASKAGGKPDMVQGCKCWSDFSSTYATLVASKSPLDISALAFLKESQMIPEIQKSCPVSAMASTNTNANNGVTMQPSFLLVAPAVFFLVVLTTR